MHLLEDLHRQDDLALLTPTKDDLNKLINICEEFSKEFYISFNAAKSKYLEFTKALTVQVSPSKHMEITYDKHLGNLSGHDSSHQLIGDAINELYRNSNKLLRQFSLVDTDMK